MRIVETEAIILRSFKLAEADKIIVSLTKNAGVKRGVAKGSRRLKSKFGASLEPYTLTKLIYEEREDRELVTIRQAEIIESNFELVKIRDTVQTLDYLCELVIEFSPPNLVDESLFRLLRTCISSLKEKPNKGNPLISYFEFWTLKLTGVLPNFDNCGKCGNRLAFEGNDSSEKSSLKCSECFEASKPIIDRQVFELLHLTRRLDPARWIASYNERNETSQKDFSELIRSWICRHLERNPKSSKVSLY